MEENLDYSFRIQTSVDSWIQECASEISLEFAKRMTYYRGAMLDMENRFKVLNEEYLLGHGRPLINSIRTRLKTIHSIQEKAKRKTIAFSIDEIEQEIHDIAGVRAICSFSEDVYAIADTLLKQDDIELISKKDYIAAPKPNGYRSLHLIVAVPVHLSRGKRMTKVEIQLRTIAMDWWASLEHQLRYKQNTFFTEDMSRKLHECAELSAMLDARMNTLRKSILGE